jgi:methionyl-tRNA formyltransferase
VKLVLWAYHEAGYRALRKLHAAGHELLVFTVDNPPYIPSVASLASALDLPVYLGVSDERMISLISEFLPDLGLSMYYPRIIHEEVLGIPSLGAFNFHPSLLPRHRGCFSAPWAILEGDKFTGVSCHEMVAKVDSGRILCQSTIAVIQKDTAFSLYYKLVDSAVSLLDEVLAGLLQSSVVLTAQEHGGCYHDRQVPYSGTIDPVWPEEMIERFIRAMYFPPHAPAALKIGEKTYPVYSMDEYMRLVQGKGR